MNTLVKSGLPLALVLCAASANALTLGVTEGVTYRASEKEIQAKFEPVAEALSRALKEPVNVRVIPTYAGLRDALKAQQVDAAFIHPAHVAFEAVKSGSYRAVAWTAGHTEYKVSFLCKDGQAIQNWSSVAGKAVVTPDSDSVTSVMTRAMLRENAVDPKKVKVQATPFQDAVPFYVEQGFATYGATASKAVIKDWQDKGGKTCAESRAVPIKQWLAASKMSDANVNALREALLGLSQTDAGRKALAAVGYIGFVAPVEDTEKKLMAWLGI